MDKRDGSTDQTAYKPGSVPPANGRDDHSSGPAIAGRFSRPTRTPQAYDGPTPCGARNPYSVLLLAGLAMPSLSPGPRWALTPPFHPYPGRNRGGLLSVALSLGSPPAGVTRRHVIVEPGLSSTARRRPRSPGHLVRAEPDGPGERGQEPLEAGCVPIGPIRTTNHTKRAAPGYWCRICCRVFGRGLQAGVIKSVVGVGRVVWR